MKQTQLMKFTITKMKICHVQSLAPFQNSSKLKRLDTKCFLLVYTVELLSNCFLSALFPLLMASNAITDGSVPDVDRPFDNKSSFWQMSLFIVSLNQLRVLHLLISGNKVRCSLPIWGNILEVKKWTEKPQSVPVSAWLNRACYHWHFWLECKFKIQFLRVVSIWAYYSLFICLIPANSHIL